MPGVRVRVEALHRFFVKGGVTLPVLSGVDLTLEAGERVAILGQSGSGKSTLLHMLGTLDRPQRGRIWFGDRDVFSRSPSELDALRNREIGFVFQFHHLLADQDALHNVMVPALIAGEPAAKAEAESAALLKRVGLGARLRHRPGELSGGEQQRVAIARALTNEPRLLLADEPTGNLDPETATAVFQQLYELARTTGVAAVIATHNLELARYMDRVFAMKDGHLEKQRG